MSKLIACCGLDCSKCDARTATMNNEEALANLREWAPIGKSQEENEYEAAEIVSTMMVTGIL